jgi:hypothetical protein
MRILQRLCLILAVAMLLGSDAGAVAELRMHVMGGGGGYTDDMSYRHRCTVGQPAVGAAGNAVYEHYAGFWYPAYECYSDIGDSQAGIPTQYELRYGGAQPSGTTGAILFAMPEAGHVTIRLYDVTGRQIQAVVDRTVEAGYHETRIKSLGLGGGVYFCRMETRGFTATQKLVLLR